MAGGAVPRHRLLPSSALEVSERGSAGRQRRGRQLGPLSGLGGLGGAPAARGRPAGAVPVPVWPQAALSLPCPALPCPAVCPWLRTGGRGGAVCPGTAARALRVSLIMFLLLFSSALGRRAGGKAGGAGRRPAGPPSRAGASAEPRRGRQVPVPAGAPPAPPGPEGPAECVSRSCAVYVYVCVCVYVCRSVCLRFGRREICL